MVLLQVLSRNFNLKTFELLLLLGANTIARHLLSLVNLRTQVISLQSFGVRSGNLARLMRGLRFNQASELDILNDLLEVFEFAVINLDCVPQLIGFFASKHTLSCCVLAVYLGCGLTVTHVLLECLRVTRTICNVRILVFRLPLKRLELLVTLILLFLVIAVGIGNWFGVLMGGF